MSYQLPELFMVFDVESVGLHGEGFAVGWVVIDSRGKELGSARVCCHISRAAGPEDGRAWVLANVPDFYCGFLSPAAVRSAFWQAWLACKAKGGALAADCCWPVEARFLAACVDDDPAPRGWEGPYPLLDVASVRLAAGLDPLATCERLPDELPAHDPLADARQSARLLREALSRLGLIAPLEPGRAPE